MGVINRDQMTSQRGAQILVYDPNKTFNPGSSGVGAGRTYGTGNAQAKEFNFDQKTTTGNFLTRAFWKGKPDASGGKTFATGEVDTHGKYTIAKDATDTGKTAATKSLSDGSKVAATQQAQDATRRYLGPEAQKQGTAVDPKSLADWRSGGGETVTYQGGYVERVGNLKSLSLDDVRDLLNKSK